MRRSVVRASAIAFLALAGVLGLALPAQAHNYLVASTPAIDSTLTELPARFSVTTNGTLLDLNSNNAGFALQVQDADKRYYGDGCIAVKGPGISTKAAIGAPGVYTVTWQVISTDGHAVSDSYQFTWAPSGASAGANTESAGSTTIPDCNGTLHPNAATSAATPGRTASVSEGTLSTILWIGGAVLAVGVAVVVTLLLTARRRKA